ncbi:MAG: hypothetical protein K8R67_13715, partial [Desulfobacteraceae bacterium]|nr:hypothetical protein [Desulfobacteraceae bacterium]
MHTNDYITICPVSGLEVLEKPEWLNKKIGNNYYLSFRKIGKNIVSAQNRGHMKDFQVQPYYKYLWDFIKDTGVEKPFIEMRDYTYLKGLPSVKELNKQRNILIEIKDSMAGLILYNTSFAVRTAVGVAFKMYKALGLETIICGNYDAAIQRAVKIFNTESIFPPDKEHKDTDDLKKFIITQHDINAFAEILGTIIWDEKEKKVMDNLTEFSRNNPLYQFIEIFNVIR